MDRLAHDILQRLEYLFDQREETLDVEFKEGLDLSNEEHRADLAKALLAMANHGGGFVVLSQGPDSRDGEQQPLPKHDDVNNVVKAYADPCFHCGVHTILAAKKERAVIVVPGGHATPVRAKRDGPRVRDEVRHVRINRYYIRKPGPSSEEPNTAQEWDTFLQRCIKNRRNELLDQFRAIMEGGRADTQVPDVDLLCTWEEASTKRLFSRVAEERPDDNPYKHGFWTLSYKVIGTFEVPSLTELNRVLRRADSIHITGWPPWLMFHEDPIKPRVFDNVLEAWLYQGASHHLGHADFWRASSDGCLYLLREYQEDDPRHTKEQGVLLDVTLPIWRVGESLLHAGRFAQELAGAEAEVEVLVRWNGLKGRKLRSWTSREHLWSTGGGNRTSLTDVVTSRLHVRAASIETQLPEFVAKLTQRLYEAFDLFEPDERMFRFELNRMTSRKY